MICGQGLRLYVNGAMLVPFLALRFLSFVDIDIDAFPLLNTPMFRPGLS